MATSLSSHQIRGTNFRSIDDSISSAALKRNLSNAAETEDDYSGSEYGDESGLDGDLDLYDFPPELLQNITTIPFSFAVNDPAFIALSSGAGSQDGRGNMPPPAQAQNIEDDRLKASFGVPAPALTSTPRKDPNNTTTCQADIGEHKGNVTLRKDPNSTTTYQADIGERKDNITLRNEPNITSTSQAGIGEHEVNTEARLPCSHCTGTGFMTAKARKEEKSVMDRQICREAAYKNQIKNLEAAYRDLENTMTAKLVKVMSTCKLAHGGGGDFFDLNNSGMMDAICSDEDEDTTVEEKHSSNSFGSNGITKDVCDKPLSSYTVKQKPDEDKMVPAFPSVLMKPNRSSGLSGGVCPDALTKKLQDIVKKTMSNRSAYVNSHRK